MRTEILDILVICIYIYIYYLQELQQKTEQQEKILKLKDEEIAAFKKRNSTGAPQQLQAIEVL